MTKSIERTGVYIMVFVALTFSQQVFSEYIEGIDTTDENGYGLDSAFKIDPNDPNYPLRGQNIVCYSGHSFVGEGTFRYTFDEINIAAADSLFLHSSILASGVYRFPDNNYCFVIQKNKDSTFYKVIVINKLEDNRFVYKYGTNTTPKNRTLVPSDYTRLFRYKPNNLFYKYNSDKTFSWEPPLPNDNHLQGYIIYVQKRGVTIDTSTPINLAQWDSIGFTDSTGFTYIHDSDGEYFNCCLAHISPFVYCHQ